MTTREYLVFQGVLKMKPILLFSSLDNGNEFMSVVSDLVTVCSINYLSYLMLLPFELNDSDHAYGTMKADPELTYFHIYFIYIYNQYVSYCNYFTESAFNNVCHNKKHNFSLCNFNIRSIKKNLDAFENHTHLLDHEFSVLGFTGTWLKNEDCGSIFGIPGYAMVKKHRAVRPGGGVAVWSKGHLGNFVHGDISIFNDFIEDVFIEMMKD